MGSGSLEKGFGNWVKKNYPDEKGDLCTCFMARGREFAVPCAYTSMITMQSWMFLGSYEKMRERLIERDTMSAMAHLGTRAFDSIAGEVVSTTAAVIQCSRAEGGEGVYVRLVDFPGEQRKRNAYLEAIQNPDCGWLYRRSADSFKSIPGTPIAYWASDAMRAAFEEYGTLSEIATPRQGLATSNNGRFLRDWWEISQGATSRSCRTRSEALVSGKRWFPIIRGGVFRKWYGEFDEVVDWLDDGKAMKEEVLRKYPYLSTPDFVIKNQDDYFKPAVTWPKISSGTVSFRYAPPGMLFEVAGACMFADEQILKMLQAFCNSSVALAALSFLSPTLNYEVGQIAVLPVADASNIRTEEVSDSVEYLRDVSKCDRDSFETSWDFKRHPLI